MFVTKKDKAIGMIVDQTSNKKVGVLLTREVNETPIEIEYYTSQWLAENTSNFDKYNAEYVFNLFLEHIKVLGASKAALQKFKLYAPKDIQDEIKENEISILEKYELFKKANEGKKMEKTTTVKKLKSAAATAAASKKEAPIVKMETVKKEAAAKKPATAATTAKKPATAATKKETPKKEVAAVKKEVVSNKKEVLQKNTSKKLAIQYDEETFEKIRKMPENKLQADTRAQTIYNVIIRFYDSKTTREIAEIAARLTGDDKITPKTIVDYRWQLRKKCGLDL